MANDHHNQLATYGAKLEKWPSREAAAAAGAALLADPSLRREWDEEKRIDAALATYREAVDEEVRTERSMERIRAGVLGRIPRRNPIRLTRIAAAVLVAGLLGGTVDLLVMPDSTASGTEIVLAETLIYGPETTGF